MLGLAQADRCTRCQPVGSLHTVAGDCISLCEIDRKYNFGCVRTTSLLSRNQMLSWTHCWRRCWETDRAEGWVVQVALNPLECVESATRGMVMIISSGWSEGKGRRPKWRPQLTMDVRLSVIFSGFCETGGSRPRISLCGADEGKRPIGDSLDQSPSISEPRGSVYFLCVKFQLSAVDHSISFAMQSLPILRPGLRYPSASLVRSIRSPSRPYSASRSWRSANSSSSDTTTLSSASASIRGFLERSAIGRLAGAYSRIQAKRPYATQICSSVVVWLCGDLSAQLLFPSEHSSHGEKDDHGPRKAHSEPAGSQGYDPRRTLRHLTVGIVASIPSYEW